MKNKQYYNVLESLKVLGAQANANTKRLKDANEVLRKCVEKISDFRKKTDEVVVEIKSSKKINSTQISMLTKELQDYNKTIKLMKGKVLSLVKSNKNFQEKIDSKIEKKIEELSEKYKLDVTELRKVLVNVKMQIAENLNGMKLMQNMVVGASDTLQGISDFFERLKLPLILTQTSTQIDKLSKKIQNISDLLKNDNSVEKSEEYIGFQTILTEFIKNSNNIFFSNSSKKNNILDKPQNNTMTQMFTDRRKSLEQKLGKEKIENDTSKDTKNSNKEIFNQESIENKTSKEKLLKV